MPEYNVRRRSDGRLVGWIVAPTPEKAIEQFCKDWEEHVDEVEISPQCDAERISGVCVRHPDGSCTNRRGDVT